MTNNILSRIFSADSESRSSWDSRFHEEAEFIARIISNQGEESESIPSESSLPSSSSSYLPILRPTNEEFLPLSVEEDSELHTSETDSIETIPKILFRDQFTQVSVVEYSSEEHLNSTRSDHTSETRSIISMRGQSIQVTPDHYSSEEHLNSSRSDHNSEAGSNISMRHQSTQVTPDHNSSEEHLNSIRSDQNSEAGSIISMTHQSTQVTPDHNSSEEHLNSIRSD